MSRYTTRNEAIEREIIDAIEANGTDVASRHEFDIDAIADAVLGDYHEGFAVVVDVDAFWQVVEANAR